MNIAMTIWGNRISPVFDSAKTLLIAQVHNAKVINRTIQAFNPGIEKQMKSVLARHCVNVLICGAITDDQFKSIENSGITVYPFISGEAYKILDSYIHSPRRISDFLMPGTPAMPSEIQNRNLP